MRKVVDFTYQTEFNFAGTESRDHRKRGYATIYTFSPTGLSRVPNCDADPVILPTDLGSYGPKTRSNLNHDLTK